MTGVAAIVVESRAAKTADEDFAREIYFESQRWIIDQEFGWDERREFEKFRRQFKPEQTQIILADGAQVGWIQLEEKPETLEVLGIFITGSHQKHGIGMHIMKSILNWARAQNKAVLFNSARINRSKKLFERLGFYITHEQDHKFRLRYVENN
jgi:GNAT superfamily N-acetyltransferase